MGELRVAIYCRVNHEDDPAIEMQEMLMKEYAIKNHYRNLRIYRDNGYSGLRFESRPGFRQLNADIQAGAIDVVITRNLSRIGRRYLDVVPWLNGLAKKGIGFISMDAPGIPFSTDFMTLCADAVRFKAGLSQNG
ncbi:recombinase family protein [Ruminococcaceae bacterium OttesenSCG-928-D13]|nr:recombinase family protein [Ruminococcaceae bacterium OttesenSCG-928-D13]